MPLTIQIPRIASTDQTGDLPGRVSLESRPGDDVERVIKRAGLDPGRFEVFLINNKAAARNAEVRDGDVLKLFPIMAGG
jgi:molybdopterin converting factor small subunit